MRTLFFGTGERRLYGAYHPASPSGEAGARRQGVVLCYPGVQDYNVCHSAFRKLATLLARAGFHVLRFDYFGTGDSSGGMGDGTPEDWVTDIRTAVAELSELAGVSKISLVGFRLGAALAAKAVSDGLSVTDLILWDPVVSGREYVTELEWRDRQQNVVLLHPMTGIGSGKAEVLGYPFPSAVRASIERIDLRTTPIEAALRVVLIVSEEHRAHDELRASLAAAREVGYAFVPENEGATNRGAREEIFLATKALTAIKDTMVGPPP
jgi:pimeloyl-ACP methyl ester carboxylesterase